MVAEINMTDTEHTEGKRARVAVITRTCNRSGLLERACRSVLQQHFQDWVHVIVNDGGASAPVDIVVESFKQQYRGRVLVIHNAERLGMQNASNVGIRSVESEFITIHDDDDSWTPMFLQRCVECLDLKGDQSRFQGVACQSEWVIERVNIDGKAETVSRQPYMPFSELRLFKMAGENYFPPIAFLFRRSAYEQVGPFRQVYNEVGDWDFNYRFLCRYDIAVITDTLAYYHWRTDAWLTGAYANSVVQDLHSHNHHISLMANDLLRSGDMHSSASSGISLDLSRFVIDALKNNEEHRKIQQYLCHQLHQVNTSIQHLHHRLHPIARTIGTYGLWKLRDTLKAWRDYASRKHARNKSRGGKNPEPPSPAPFSNLDLSGVEVLSLDVFDTVFYRLCPRPVDVFQFMEPDVASVVPNIATGFADLRIRAEHLAREKCISEGKEDCSLEEIYEVIGRIAVLPAEILNRLMAFELQAERRLLYINPEIKALYDKALQSVSKIIFISDMYLPQSFIAGLLKDAGFDASRVYVSSEWRCTKHAGTLYRKVLENSAVEPAKVMHIGDNHHADLCQASAQGIKAVLWNPVMTHAKAYYEQSHAPRTKWGVISNLFAGLARRNLVVQGGESGLWEKIGYELVGPLYLSYALWFLKRAIDDGISDLFLLSRDGYNLVEVANRLIRSHELKLSTHYLYSSRRMLNFPAFVDEYDDEALGFLTTPNPGMRVRDFVERIGLVADDYQNQIRAAGLGDLDRLLTTGDGTFSDLHDAARLKHLFAMIWPNVSGLAAKERSNLNAYLKSQNYDPQSSAIVDVGWQCSSALAFQRLVASGSHTPQRVRGYYFGTWKYASKALQEGAIIDSFFFHLHAPAHRAELIAECVELLESFFSAPHPSVIGVKKDSDQWIPVHGARELDGYYESRIGEATRAALRFVDDAVPYLPDVKYWIEEPKYLESVLWRLLRQPTASEAHELGGISHRNTFGVDGPLRYLARIPDDKTCCFDVAALRHEYAHTFWKKGFLAQLHPRDRARLGV